MGPDSLTPRVVRDRLRFDVERLRQAAGSLHALEGQLRALKTDLEHRADDLGRHAAAQGAAELGGSGDWGRVSVVYAQAQALADLARKTSLTDILLRRSGRLSLVACMALGRWIEALSQLADHPVSETTIRQHVRAGRLAHRTLRTLKPGSGMRRYCGLLTSSLVVAEFVHPANVEDIEGHMDSGIARARLRPSRTDEAILEAVSAALRTGARLVEGMVDRADPAVKLLASSAETLERDVENRLRAP